MTRGFLAVLTAVALLCACAFAANESADTLQAAIYLSLAQGLLLTYACVSGLLPAAKLADIIRNRRVVSDEQVDGELEPIYGWLLEAAPAPVCWHVAGSASPLCDCRVARERAR